MKVIIVNYEMGNVGSLRNMLRKIGVESEVSSDPKKILEATHLILPGVGAFAKGMENLRRLNLVEPLKEAIQNQGISTLGICLGMQLFAEFSEEGNYPGLGLIQGNVIRFKQEIRPGQSIFRIPHMGWNYLKLKAKSKIFNNISQEARFYFVHSYHFSKVQPDYISAVTLYGQEFPSAVCRNNLQGVQFHPEKSHKYGMQIIKNFLEFFPQ